MRTSDARTTLSHLVVSDFFVPESTDEEASHTKTWCAHLLFDCYPHVWMRRQCSRFSCCDNGSFPSEGAQMRWCLDKCLVFFCFFFFCFKCCCTCFFGGSQTATEVSWRVNCTIWERSNYLYAICVQISRDYPKNINVSSVDVLTCQAKFRVDWWLDHHRMPAIFFPTAVIL